VNIGGSLSLPLRLIRIIFGRTTFHGRDSNGSLGAWPLATALAVVELRADANRALGKKTPPSAVGI